MIINFKKFFSFILLFCVIAINCGSIKGIKEFKNFTPKVRNVVNTRKLPLIFHKNYDISFLGLEKLHPFDSQKYGKVVNYLIQNAVVNESWFHIPRMVSQEELLTVHTKDYLDSLNKSQVVAKITEIAPLAYVPNFLLQSNLLDSMRLATGGTILGAELALNHGWAINFSGGYHHAKSSNGEGFCVYADIPLAVKQVWKFKSEAKVMIIDLDAHQGNGHEEILKDDKRVIIFDVYNSQVYPNDTEVKKYIKYDYPVKSFIKDSVYLSLVKQELAKAIEKEKPNFIIYNAGTDIFENDPLGEMSVSKSGIIERDQFVFKIALENKIPILMLLSGGYTKESFQIIGESIKNILQSFKLIKF